MQREICFYKSTFLFSNAGPVYKPWPVDANLKGPRAYNVRINAAARAKQEEQTFQTTQRSTLYRSEA